LLEYDFYVIRADDEAGSTPPPDLRLRRKFIWLTEEIGIGTAITRITVITVPELMGAIMDIQEIRTWRIITAKAGIARVIPG
jgi:hypothetical protein